jgi:hypothetical protein
MPGVNNHSADPEQHRVRATHDSVHDNKIDCSGFDALQYRAESNASGFFVQFDKTARVESTRWAARLEPNSGSSAKQSATQNPQNP